MDLKITKRTNVYKREGTYRGIHISITETRVDGVPTWKWAAGLRGHGEAGSYNECVSLIKYAIDTSIEMERKQNG